MPLCVQQSIIWHIGYLKQKTGFNQAHLLSLYGITKSSFHRWQKVKVDKPKEPSQIRQNPRSLLPEEVEQVVGLRKLYPLVGYTSFLAVLKQLKLLGYWSLMVNDAYSRFLLHWKLLPDMTTDSVSIFIQ